MALPAGQTVDVWRNNLAEIFRKEEFEARVAAEQEEARREAKRMEKRKQAQVGGEVGRPSAQAGTGGWGG